jgi:benzil reductase ((S)-benzoin forming)
MKAVVITGTSSGLGRAMFDLLYDKPVYLVCIARRFLPYQVSASKGRRGFVKLIKHDLARVNTLLAKCNLPKTLAAKKCDEVIFVSNAGTVEPICAIGGMDERAIIESASVNLVAPVLLANALLAPGVLRGAKASLLNISTGAAVRPIEGWPMYCATKAGIRMFFDVLREQCRGRPDITVHNIDPGVMDTDMQRRIRLSEKAEFPMRDHFKSLKKEGVLLPPVVAAKAIIKKYIRV